MREILINDLRNKMAGCFSAFLMPATECTASKDLSLPVRAVDYRPTSDIRQTSENIFFVFFRFLLWLGPEPRGAFFRSLAHSEDSPNSRL